MFLVGVTFVLIGILADITSTSARQISILRILLQTNTSTSSSSRPQNGLMNSASASSGSGNSLNSASVPQQFIDPSFQSANGVGSSGNNATSGTFHQNFIDPSTFINSGNLQPSGSSGTNQLQQPGSMGNPLQFLSPGIFNNFQTLNSNGAGPLNPSGQPLSQSGTGSSSGGSFSGTFLQPSQFLNPGMFLVGR